MSFFLRFQAQTRLESQLQWSEGRKIPSEVKLRAVEKKGAGIWPQKIRRYILLRFSGLKQMDYFESKRPRSSRYILEASEQEFSFSQHSDLKTIKNPHEHFQNLYIAKDRFCDFVNELGEDRFSEIREDILSHCQQNTKKERIYQAYMSDENILKMMNLRIDKMIKNKRIKKNWSEEDVQILIWVISKYADKKGLEDVEKDVYSEDWEAIASLIPGVTGESCMFKWLSLKKINLATNNWSEEESNLLAKLVSEKGFEGKSKDSKDWKMVSQKLYFLNNRADKIFRNAKQCREHWNCYLNPNLKKGPWKPEEDIQLLKCIKQNKGSKKWSEIVKYFDGRTENALKNRYTLIIDKQKKHNKHKTELQIIEEYLVRCYVDQFTTEIKQYSSEEEKEDSSLSFDQNLKEEVMSVEDRFLTPQKGDAELKKTTSVASPIAPITPVKIEKFGQFLSFMSAKKIDLQSIQFGTLNNGIFQKTDVQGDKTSIQQAHATGGKLHLKRYSSSLF